MHRCCFYGGCLHCHSTQGHISGKCKAYTSPQSTRAVFQLIADTSKFDDLTFGTPPSVQNVIPTPYNYLSYTGFVGHANNPDSLQEAHSTPNEIGSNGTIDYLEDPAIITVDYPRSNIKSFGLTSAYVGCAITDEGGEGVMVPCTLSFLGFRALEEKDFSALKDCIFTGTEAMPALQKCEFGPGFARFEEVLVVPVLDPVKPLLWPTMLLDDVAGTVVFKN